MGLLRKKVKNLMVCNHRGAFGEACHKCGAAKNQWGPGYETRLITVEQIFLEVCAHLDELGHKCSKCGDRLTLGLRV